jgi:Domain of unknown function (DUF4129)
VSLLVNSSWNSGHGPHVHLPFLSFAIPAVAAVTAVATTARLGWRRWPRSLLIAVIAIIGAMITAGCLSELSVTGSAWRAAVQPWSSQGHRLAEAAGAAWFVAIVVWTRGTWLGTVRPSFRHAAWSASLSAIAFVGIFAGRAPHRDVIFRATTSDAGALLVLCFLLTGTALALIRQREIEREVLYGSSAGPGFRWLGVLVVPLALIAGVSLLVAVGGGPLVRLIGRAVLVVVRAVRWVFTKLGHLVSGGGQKRPAPAPLRPTRSPSPVAHAPLRLSGSVPIVVWAVVGALIVAAVVWLVIRYVRPRWLRRTHSESSDVDEERDSVFTWSHLIEQLHLAVSRMLDRLRHLWRRKETARPTTPGVALEGATLNPFEDIRTAYRQVLVVARQRQSARGAAETAREFDHRLSPVLFNSAESDPSTSLHVLTSLYQRVRYGDDRLDDPELESGHAAADAVIAQLQGLSSTEPN